ncbi:hypothetical protein [Avibacterium paragallinarum]
MVKSKGFSQNNFMDMMKLGAALYEYIRHYNEWD